MELSERSTRKVILILNICDLVAALNATVAVERVRSKQSHSEEGKQEPSVMASQVLNPELSLNHSGNIKKVPFP